MSRVEPKYSKDEFAQRGEHFYENSIRPQLRSEDDGKLVAIDIETGDWELGQGELEAADRLRKRKPEAQIWLRRVGKDKSVHRFGQRTMKKDGP